MEDFQLPEDLLGKIVDYFSQEHTNEPCGALIITRGKLKFKAIKNTSETPDTFILDPIQYTAISRNIFMLVHGHDDNCVPSKHDMVQSDKLNIPYMIFNLSNMEYFIYYPLNYLKLLGKEYQFGVNDCFESCRSWYLMHGIIMPERLSHWEDDWIDKGFSYIEDEIGLWPFVPVPYEPKYGDLIIFSDYKTGLGNHLGIYVEDDKFFHHAYKRLSCVDELFPLWWKSVKGMYRYENGPIRRLSWGEIW
jgi:proteasome lid subunit RPN8/RPN11